MNLISAKFINKMRGVYRCCEDLVEGWRKEGSLGWGLDGESLGLGLSFACLS